MGAVGATASRGGDGSKRKWKRERGEHKVNDENLKSEFEVPPNTKVRVVATVDRKLCEEMKQIHEQEVQKAKREDRVEPDWSNTIEMLLRKGAKAYKSSFSDAK